MTYPQFKTRKTTNHWMHFWLGFLTGGLWWFTGWPYCALRNRRARSVTTVSYRGAAQYPVTAGPEYPYQTMIPPAPVHEPIHDRVFNPQASYRPPQPQSQPQQPQSPLAYQQRGYHSAYMPQWQQAGAPRNGWRPKDEDR